MRFTGNVKEKLIGRITENLAIFFPIPYILWLTEIGIFITIFNSKVVTYGDDRRNREIS
jgi:hypothetical protein